MRKIDFSSDRVTGNILRTAFPMLVAQVLSLLYSIVDRIYIGRIPGYGTDSLGAVGLCFPVIMIITGFTNLFGLGGAPLFSIRLGKGEEESAARIQNTVFRLLLFSSLILMFFFELSAGPVLGLFGALGAEKELALLYLRIYLVGTPAVMISSGLNPLINAQGFSLIGMGTVTVGAVSNLILDPIFIFRFGMGVGGAAAATVISQFLSLAFVAAFMKSRHNEFRLSLGRELHYAGSIISLGTSSFIMQATNSLVQIVCNSILINTGGVIFVSVMTIVSSVRSIMDVPVLAISEGASPSISYNFGAGNGKRVMRSIRVMIMMAFPYTLLGWILIMRFPGMFIRIFSPDPRIYDKAVRALHLYFFAFVFQTFQYSAQTVFRALNKKYHTVFFSLFRKAVLVVPLSYLFAYGMKLGTDGVFIAEPVSNVVGGLASFITMLVIVIPQLKRLK